MPGRSKPYDEFPHFGMAKGNDIWFAWKQKEGGEIVFQLGNEKGLHIGDLMKKICAPAATAAQRDVAQLEIVNQILVHYRPHAIPDGNGYHAGSAGVDAAGRLFVDVNDEEAVVDGFAGRGCGETDVKRTYQKGTGITDVKFDVLYLMSGMATKLPNGKLQEKEHGHVACLCGECRQNMRGHARRFVMIPVNDGQRHLTINKVAKSAKELKKNEAWEISEERMYPLPRNVPIEMFPDMLKAGFDYVTNSECAIVPMQTPSTEIAADAISQDGHVTLSPAQFARLQRSHQQTHGAIEALEENPSITNINIALQQQVKDVYAAHKDKLTEDRKDKSGEARNLEVTSAVIQMKNGKFYSGKQAMGKGWLQSKPSAYITALNNADNRTGIEAVYMTPFDYLKIQDELAAAKGSNRIIHQQKQPNPADLGRLIKHIMNGDRPKIYIVPPNDCTLSEDALNELIGKPLDIVDVFGPEYSNPKKINGMNGEYKPHRT